jgi:transcription termination factor Rho
MNTNHPLYLHLTGTLHITAEGHGFLHLESASIYVSQSQVRRFLLRESDRVTGMVRPRRANEAHPSLVRIELVNGISLEEIMHRRRHQQPGGP